LFHADGQTDRHEEANILFSRCCVFSQKPVWVNTFFVKPKQKQNVRWDTLGPYWGEHPFRFSKFILGPLSGVVRIYKFLSLM